MCTGPYKQTKKLLNYRLDRNGSTILKAEAQVLSIYFPKKVFNCSLRTGYVRKCWT